MSSGRVHALVTVAISPAVGIATYAYIGDSKLSIYATAGCLLGLILTPDLDQEGVSFGEWWIIRLTLGLGFVWLGLWGPYSIIIPHRSPLSHWPILGTALRLIYLYFGLRLLMQLDCFTFSLPSLGSIASTPWVRWVILGLAASDVGHWVFDFRFLSRRFGHF